jgi:hypothetical protein
LSTIEANFIMPSPPPKNYNNHQTKKCMSKAMKMGGKHMQSAYFILSLLS